MVVRHLLRGGLLIMPMRFGRAIPVKVMAAFLVLVAAVAATAFISLDRTSGVGDDPTQVPIPTIATFDSAQSIVVRVLFSSPADVDFLSGVVSTAPPAASIGAPPLIRIDVFDVDGSLIGSFNDWHPLWVEAQGEDGGMGTFVADTGEGRFVMPFAPNIGDVIITDIELGQELIQIDAHQIVVDYCAANAADPACASVGACAGDVNGDGVVTARDIAATARAIPSRDGDRRWNADADVNGDGVVNVEDLKIVIGSFLDPACR